MSERDEAVKLADRILERPYGDPDDDLGMLSRQFLRAVERAEKAEATVAEFEAEKRQDMIDGLTGKMGLAVLLHKAEARVRELEATVALHRRQDLQHLEIIETAVARVAVLREALGNLLGPIHHFQKYGDSDGVALRLIEEGTKADAALATLDPAATALTERLTEAQAIFDWIDAEGGHGRRIHEAIAAWRRLEEAP